MCDICCVRNVSILSTLRLTVSSHYDPSEGSILELPFSRGRGPSKGPSGLVYLTMQICQLKSLPSNGSCPLNRQTSRASVRAFSQSANQDAVISSLCHLVGWSIIGIPRYASFGVGWGLFAFSHVYAVRLATNPAAQQREPYPVIQSIWVFGDATLLTLPWDRELAGQAVTSPKHRLPVSPQHRLVCLPDGLLFRCLPARAIHVATCLPVVMRYR